MSDAPESKPCAICGKPAVARFRPFCSPRCKDVDLNRWFKGVYSVPAVEAADDTEEPEPERRRETE
jgi:uncharacterized protein